MGPGDSLIHDQVSSSSSSKIPELSTPIAALMRLGDVVGTRPLERFDISNGMRPFGAASHGKEPLLTQSSLPMRLEPPTKLSAIQTRGYISETEVPYDMKKYKFTYSRRKKKNHVNLPQSTSHRSTVTPIADIVSNE